MLSDWPFSSGFSIAQPARSDPRNHFVVNFLSAICLNLRVFRHFKDWQGTIVSNRINILSAICSNLRVFHHLIVLDKSRHVWDLKNCIKSYHSIVTIVDTFVESYQFITEFIRHVWTWLDMFRYLSTLRI